MSPVNINKTSEASSNNRSPLDEFKGEITDINEDNRNNPRSGKTNTYIVFDIADLEIIKANEPYSFPTFKFDIMELNFPNTNWEIFKESLRNVGFANQPLNNLISKRVHIKWATAMMNMQVVGSNPVAYETRLGSCWQVMEVEGLKNTSAQLNEAIIKMANGKTAGEFKMAFMNDASIRTLTGYSDMMVAVANNTLLDALVTSGMLTNTNGTYASV